MATFQIGRFLVSHTVLEWLHVPYNSCTLLFGMSWSACNATNSGLVG